jgi:hypothetical protein
MAIVGLFALLSQLTSGSRLAPAFFQFGEASMLRANLVPRVHLIMAGMAVLATAKADDFREAIDAAFCYGVDQKEIETSLKLSKSADVSQSIAKLPRSN